MEIVIMNRSDARSESFRKNRPDTAIISITDHRLENNAFAKSPWIKATLKLKFDDVVADGVFGLCITDGDAESIRQFVEKVKDKVKRIIVHCEAGISRSAGVAAALMKVLNGDDMAVFRSKLYCPNMTCYRKVLLAFLGEVDEDDLREKETLNRKLWFSWFM